MAVFYVLFLVYAHQNTVFRDVLSWRKALTPYGSPGTPVGGLKGTLAPMAFTGEKTCNPQPSPLTVPLKLL